MTNPVEIIDENQLRSPAKARAHLDSLPEPIRIVLSVLSELAPERAEKLRKPLPAYAMTLFRQGKEVTEQILREALVQGDDAIIGPRLVFNKAAETVMERYGRIVQDLKKNIYKDNPAFADRKRFPCAIKRGDLQVIKEIMSCNNALDHRFLADMLVDAAYDGHLDIVTHLVRSGVDSSSPYALAAACSQGRMDIVKFFIEHKVLVRDNGDYAVRMVARNGHLEILKLLIENGAGFWINRNIALTEAAEQGHSEVVKFSIENGANGWDLNDSALKRAAKNGHLDVVKILVRNGADVHAENDFALCKAALRGHLNIVEFLIEHDAPVGAYSCEALLNASQQGHLEVVKYLAGHGANIRFKDDAPLRTAAGYGHLEVVKFLIDNGADVNAGTGYILAMASAGGHLEVVKHLIERGADVRASNDLALRLAAGNGHLETVRFLAENGADVRVSGDEPLRLANTNGEFKVCHYFVQKGASLAALAPGERVFATRMVDRITVWLEKTGQYPLARLESEEPGSFDLEAVKTIGDILRKEGYSALEANRHVFNAVKFFGTAERVMDYFEKWAETGSQPMHDVVQMIPQQEGHGNLDAWRDAVIQQGPEMAKLIKFSDKIPQPLKSADGKTWSLTKTREEAAMFAYSKGKENPKLAGLFNKHQMSESNFNQALDLIKKFKGKTENRIPNITINGNSFGLPKAEFKKLPDGDYRGLVLGQITNCCQSIGGAGDACAKHGFASENGGFYVVATNDNEIIGQSWAWRGKKGELVLDSLETLGQRVTPQQWTDLATEFAKALKDTDVEALHIGKGGGTPRNLFFGTAQDLALPKDYNAYRDSREQYQVKLR